jgi:hypothetical protein
VYEIPARNELEASETMMEAIALDDERRYFLATYIKGPGDPKGKGRQIHLDPPKGWIKLLADQLFGRK